MNYYLNIKVNRTGQSYKVEVTDSSNPKVGVFHITSEGDITLSKIIEVVEGENKQSPKTRNRLKPKKNPFR